MNRFQTSLAAAVTGVLAASAVTAEPVRLRVTIENLAPQNATFLTPFWVGFHDATFDTYNGGTPASSLPIEGSVAMERLCEDGNNGPISDDFALLVPAGVDATVPGPNGPIAPGDITAMEFDLDSELLANRWFSYASMILPSNDFCISNGNPRAHQVFTADGEFVAENFFVIGSEVLDAGTEVNDEIPANTAFFGQATPNTGVVENGLIGTIGSDVNGGGFLPAGSGGILDDPRYAMADFTQFGYPVTKFSFELVDTNQIFDAVLSGDQEVPPVATNSSGDALLEVSDDGMSLTYDIQLRSGSNGPLSQVTMAHLHLAPAGENGPVVVNLLPGIDTSRLVPIRELVGELEAADLVGPLAGQPLTALLDAMDAGDVYINIHTRRNPAGEIRGQISGN
ncbi:MAG: spondin domain-containing protein [Pseudomonadota bacterium]